MSTKATDTKEGIAVRPTYVVLGVDETGAHHIYRTTDETVHVIDPDRGRERVEHIGTRPVDDWMAYVGTERGWADERYGSGILSQFVDDLRGGI